MSEEGQNNVVTVQNNGGVDNVPDDERMNKGGAVEGSPDGSTIQNIAALHCVALSKDPEGPRPLMYYRGSGYSLVSDIARKIFCSYNT